MKRKHLIFVGCLILSAGCVSMKKPLLSESDECAHLSLAKDQAAFRDYTNAPKRVKDFYAAQHQHQTYEFVKDQQAQFDAIASDIRTAKNDDELARLEKQGKIKRMSLWQALEALDGLVDQSDPDLDLPNSLHALQSAEAIRRDLKCIAKANNLRVEEIDWLVLVGLLHDIGKVDALLRNIPQWAAVGDTFPLGCAFAKENVLAESFKSNPDSKNPRFNSKNGIYAPAIGLDNLTMAWGHDEYARRVLSMHGDLPKPALSMIRFHSFYPMHSAGAYHHLLDPKTDPEQIRWIKIFNPYDLYSKSPTRPNKEELKAYYQALINKYFPPKPHEEARMISWPILAEIVK